MKKNADRSNKSGFGGTVTDMGAKHAKGMDSSSSKTGFGGTLSDLGAKDAEGVGEENEPS